MQTFLKTLTSSEILDLMDTPIEVIPAQGSGFYITPHIVLLRSHYGTTVYGNLTSTLELFINGVSITPTQMSTTFLGNAYDSFVYYSFANSILSPGLKVSDCDNQGIYIKNTGISELSGGDGTLDVFITAELNNV